MGTHSKRNQTPQEWRDEEQEFLNLRLGLRSRKRQNPGDVFAVTYEGPRVFIGRVIGRPYSTDKGRFMNSGWLVYIYRGVHDVAAIPNREVMVASNLLLARIVSNRVWLDGGFEKLGNVPLGDGDVWPNHCFTVRKGKLFSGPDGVVLRYHDQHHNQVDEPFEPVVAPGLIMLYGMDRVLSEVLGITDKPWRRVNG